jgi:hypothetical protein
MHNSCALFWTHRSLFAQLVRIILDTQVLIHAQLVRIILDTQVLIHAQLVRIILDTQVLTTLDSLVHWTSSTSFQVADQAHTASRATFLGPYRHCKANAEAFLCCYVPNTLHNSFKTVRNPSNFKITGLLLTMHNILGLICRLLSTGKIV